VSERVARGGSETSGRSAPLPDSVEVLAAHAREHEAIMSHLTRLYGEVGDARDDSDKLVRVVAFLCAQQPQAVRDALVRMLEGS
jgi:hypothetical protein